MKKIGLFCFISSIITTVCFIFYKFNYRMPLKEYTKYALYMAYLDDEIARNELEGNSIGGRKIKFPHKKESLMYKYRLFLNLNKKKTKSKLKKEIKDMEKRFQSSKKYINQPKIDLDVEMIK